MRIKKVSQSSGVVANVVDNLTSTSTTAALSANQGKVLNDEIEALDTAYSGLLNFFYPVGTIYETTSTDLDTTTKIATHFGGTWEAYGAGRVLVGVDTSQTEFNTVGKTGGEKTHTLTVNEMPSHKHKGYLSNGTKTNITQAADGGYNSGQATQDMQSVGGNQPHNNLQPYIVVYRYRRTA